MNPPRDDQVKSPDDLYTNGGIDQSLERPFNADFPDSSSRQPEIYLIPREGVNSVAAVESSPDFETIDEEREPDWRGTDPEVADEATESEVPPESVSRSSPRVLYDSVADVFSDAEIAELLRVSEEQVAEWKRGSVLDWKEFHRLANLSAVVSKLRAIYKPHVIADWLQGINSRLGGARPIDLLVRGQLSRVMAAIEAQRGGAPI